MHSITEVLAVGNVEDARQPPSTIGAVLFLADEIDPAPPPDVPFLKVGLVEFAEPSPLMLHSAVEWLERQPDGTRRLVCCRAGMGRSVSVAIAYLCCVAGLAFPEAVALAKARRPGATPLPNLERCVQKVQELRQTKSGESVPSR